MEHQVLQDAASDGALAYRFMPACVVYALYLTSTAAQLCWVRLVNVCVQLAHESRLGGTCHPEGLSNSLSSLSFVLRCAKLMCAFVAVVAVAWLSFGRGGRWRPGGSTLAAANL
jgi:hypothetical protein